MNNPPGKAHIKTVSALAAVASTFLLDQKVDKKSLPAALAYPLIIHYREDLKISNTCSKSSYPSFIKWVPSYITEVREQTTTRLRTLIVIKSAEVRCFTNIKDKPLLRFYKQLLPLAIEQHTSSPIGEERGEVLLQCKENMYLISSAYSFPLW